MEERDEEKQNWGNRIKRHFFSRSKEQFVEWLHGANDREVEEALVDRKDNEVTRILDHYHSGCEVSGCRERIRKLFY